MLEPELSIVLPCLNGYGITKECLEWIGRNTDANYEIILIDDKSTDEVKDIEDYSVLQMLNRPYIIVRHSENLGYAASTNDGINLARGEYIALFNNDMFITKGWYQDLRSILDSDDRIWVASSSLILVEEGGLATMVDEANLELIQENGWAIIESGPHLEYAWKDTFGKHKYKTATYSKDPWIESAGHPWLVKKDTFKELGVFDEQFYPSTWEDIDMIHRIYMSGHIVARSSKSFAYHLSSYTQKHTLRPMLGNSYELENKQRYIKKWGDGG